MSMILNRMVEKFKSRKAVRRKYWTIIVITKTTDLISLHLIKNLKIFLVFFILGIDFL